MDQSLFKVAFWNRSYPGFPFEIATLEHLLDRDDIKHDPKSFHHVQFFILLVVVEGEGSHFVDFKEYHLHAGNVLTIRKDQIHKFADHSFKGYILLFKDEFLVGFLEELEALKTLQLFNELLGSPKLDLAHTFQAEILPIVEEINREFSQKRDELATPIIRSLLHILISRLYREKSDQHQQLTQKKYLVDFINFQKLVEQHCQTTKKVKDYASMMGCTTKTLNNIVQSIVYKTAKVFIDEILMNQIKRQLIYSSKPIKEIAYQMGFEEPTNFFKFFKRYTGISPESFRKTY